MFLTCTAFPLAQRKMYVFLIMITFSLELILLAKRERIKF